MVYHTKIIKQCDIPNEPHLCNIEAKIMKYLKTTSVSAAIDKLASLLERIIYSEIKKR